MHDRVRSPTELYPWCVCIIYNDFLTRAILSKSSQVNLPVVGPETTDGQVLSKCGQGIGFDL